MSLYGSVCCLLHTTSISSIGQDQKQPSGSRKGREAPRTPEDTTCRPRDGWTLKPTAAQRAANTVVNEIRKRGDDATMIAVRWWPRNGSPDVARCATSDRSLAWRVHLSTISVDSRALIPVRIASGDISIRLPLPNFLGLSWARRGSRWQVLARARRSLTRRRRNGLLRAGGLRNSGGYFPWKRGLDKCACFQNPGLP